MHGRGVCVLGGASVPRGRGVHGRRACVAGGMHGQGDAWLGGHAWLGGMLGQGVHACMPHTHTCHLIL